MWSSPGSKLKSSRKGKGDNVPKVWLYQGEFEISFLKLPSYDLWQVS
jgi:hypothetical protein